MFEENKITATIKYKKKSVYMKEKRKTKRKSENQ